MDPHHTELDATSARELEKGRIKLSLTYHSLSLPLTVDTLLFPTYLAAPKVLLLLCLSFGMAGSHAELYPLHND